LTAAQKRGFLGRMENASQNNKLPLAGLRVLDLATFVASPFAAAILGEFGADVIKIEQPQGGDPLRKFGTPSPNGDGYCWLSEQRNKRSVTLDIRKPQGAEIFKRLVAGADALCENFRPGTLEKWGLGPEVLKEINPRLVLLRISGYGQTGPYKDRPGFARIAHAFGGLTYLTGEPGGPPLTPGSTSLADYISGLYGALGVLLSLRARDATGEGQEIDIALYESIFRVLDEMAPLYAATGFVRPRLGLGTANVCPHGHFECGDGEWVAIACTSDKMWQRMADVLNRSELGSDPRYDTAANRVANREEVDGLVAAFTLSLPRDKVMAACVAGDVPIAPVYSIADIFADEQYKARQTLVTVEDETAGPITVPAVLPRLSATPGRIAHLGPALGKANGDIYGGELGFSEDELAALKKDGVI
jgi:crotonobetainyl-CoA:carnitine CoA-transferase CaiB-like acyl-CoA transferase